MSNKEKSYKSIARFLLSTDVAEDENQIKNLISEPTGKLKDFYKDRDILLKDTDSTLTNSRRIWQRIPNPSHVQWDVALPIDEHEDILEAIKALLEDSGLEHKPKDRNLDGSYTYITAVNVEVAKNYKLTSLPYQFFFHEDNLVKIKAIANEKPGPTGQDVNGNDREPENHQKG
jgi:hypothetical protein